MASPVLHIKDAYYFEVPKSLCRWDADEITDFPDWWIRNDADFQSWEANRLIHDIPGILIVSPTHDEMHELVHTWEHWKHEDHANFGVPLDEFLERQYESLQNQFASWGKKTDNQGKSFAEFLNETDTEYDWFALPRNNPDWVSTKWSQVKDEAGDLSEYITYAEKKPWASEKIEGYNKALDGKILIPQPFGELRNAYQSESGFCVSKFMIVEVAVALVLVFMFSWLAKRVVTGESPRGRCWNFLESFLLFLRDEVARPAIGGHDADRFVPLLWSIFFFILGCNLMGLVPWVGNPTGAFGMTFALACITFGTVVLSGSEKFGVVGFWKNQLPSMDLPFVIAIVLKPIIWAIEVASLFIKHGVLSIRLLANMVAGHLVLLGIMGLAFTFEGALSPNWGITAVIAIIGSTLFSCLELFVAFLQAYIFTFLSALFIGAAVHHH